MNVAQTAPGLWSVTERSLTREEIALRCFEIILADGVPVSNDPRHYRTWAKAACQLADAFLKEIETTEGAS
jgi:hypothetical protein